jgi:enoyl-CoA hydratase/carnithine racemase
MLENDDALWVGLVTFAGEHTTAGLDLPLFREAFTSGRPSHQDGRIDPFGLRTRTTKPVVMAVQGAIYTVGIELMLAADIVIAADSCRLCQMEPKRGLAVLGGANYRYIDRAGWGNAMYHLLRADTFDAQAAYRLGFFQEVVPHGIQRERAFEVAREVAANAPIALRWMKRNSLTYVLDGERAAIDEIPEMMRATAGSEDAAEGVRAFLEKRPAVFAGR